MRLAHSPIGLSLAAAAALAALWVVAGSLPALELTASAPLTSRLDQAIPGIYIAVGGNPLWGKIILGAALLLAISLIAAGLLALSRRKRKLDYAPFDLWRLVPLIALILLLMLAHPLTSARPAPAALEPAPPPDQAGINLTPALVSPGPSTLPPDGLLYGISLALALVLVLMGGWGLGRVRRPAPPAAIEPAAPALARVARSALEALQTGDGWQNAVIRCYWEMSRIVAQRRGLHRRVDLTPREFVRDLVEAGLPGAPLEHLTTLFERARYGLQAPRPSDETEAEACLTALVNSFGSGDGGAGYAPD